MAQWWSIGSRHKVLASDSSAGVGMVGEGEREKELLSPKVRMRGMLEVAQERQQEVPESRRDTNGQGVRGGWQPCRPPKCPSSAAHRQRACDRETGTEYRHQGRQRPVKGEARSVISKIPETGQATLGTRDHKSCPLAA